MLPLTAHRPVSSALPRQYYAIPHIPLLRCTQDNTCQRTDKVNVAFVSTLPRGLADTSRVRRSCQCSRRALCLAARVEPTEASKPCKSPSACHDVQTTSRPSWCKRFDGGCQSQLVGNARRRPAPGRAAPQAITALENEPMVPNSNV